MADLTNVSAEALTEVLGWVKEAKEFATEQAPLLAQEIVTYGILANAVSVCLGAVVLTTGSVLVLRLLKHGKQWEGNDKEGTIIGHVFGGIGCVVIGSTITFGSLFPMLQAIVAPRLYVIKYLSELLK